jgi:2-polyprenyl-3-methyl-5-hydroxy-6-metoxy-1,4-benzoquinol methylase
MAGDGWNHNTHYHRLLLAAVPLPCGRALDVGCGRGGFARHLATMATRVDALDRDRATIDAARRLSASVDNVRFIEDDFMTWTPEHRYDTVTMVATLHHLPFDAAVRKAASLLNPSGVLIALGLDRPPSRGHQLAQAAVAVPVSHWYGSIRGYSDVGAPIREPEMTFAEIRDAAAPLLPGAVLRRHLLWRYSIVWRKPESE